MHGGDLGITSSGPNEIDPPVAHGSHYGRHVDLNADSERRQRRKKGQQHSREHSIHPVEPARSAVANRLNQIALGLSMHSVRARRFWALFEVG